MALIISNIKLIDNEVLVSFQPKNLTFISSLVKNDGLYEYPKLFNLFGPQKGCSPSLCKFIINPIFNFLNFSIKLNFLIKTSLSL